jgi:hypothetical protein
LLGAPARDIGLSVLAKLPIPAVFCAMLSACSAPPTCDADGAWRTVEVWSGGSPDELLFTFDVPTEASGGASMGLDSFVGDYACGSAEIFYDRGGFSDPLDRAAAQPRALDETRTIDGRSARVVRWEEPDAPDGLTYRAGVHFEGMLTLTVHGSDPAAQDLGLAIFATIDLP